MADVNCRSCRFYWQNGNVLGSCRRFPEYQHKSENEWCGEFASKMMALPVIDPPQIDTKIEIKLPENDATVEVKRRGRPKKEAGNV